MCLVLYICFLNVSAVQVNRLGFIKVYRKATTLFYHGPFVKKGRDQHLAILLLLLLLLLLQSSIGPIRAEQVPPSSSVIG